MNIAALDWIVGAVILASMLLGAWRGLVHEVLALAGWVMAFITAQLYASTVGAALPLDGFSTELRYAAGFVLTFIAVAFAAGLISWLIKKMIEKVGLAPIDRALGACFGLLRGAVISLAVATVVLMTPLKDATWWKESLSGTILSASLKAIKPVLPQEMAQYIKSELN